jgi:hypothetical protein
MKPFRGSHGQVRADLAELGPATPGCEERHRLKLESQLIFIFCDSGDSNFSNWKSSSFHLTCILVKQTEKRLRTVLHSGDRPSVYGRLEASQNYWCVLWVQNTTTGIFCK